MSKTPLAASLAFAGLLGLSILAGPAAADEPLAAPYQLDIGRISVTALSDGQIPVPLADIMRGEPRPQIEAALARAGKQSPVTLAVNTYLVAMPGGRLVLIDTGTGDLLGQKLGHLAESLKAAGHTPDEIDDIVLTHIHADHSGGLTRNGKAVFPKARLHVAERDAAYWLSDAARAAAPEAARRGFDEAIAMTAPYRETGRFATFADGADPVPGLQSILRAGHTPGHSSIVVSDGGEKLVIWGDITHGEFVQFAEPEVTIDFDVDQDAARQSRMDAMKDAAAKGYLVAGAHITFPGIGRVTPGSDGAAYGWEPVGR
ncbi:MBL fold metallo-hydrolase (plasmid) [Tistrella mobilis]|uniref:MBL fold metallo-hydrolase n=1 Tax=Tistrella mobilis TaxID=171437 RepID=UPI003557D02A